MTSTPAASPLHSSVHTSTSLNTSATGEQMLVVTTSRLVMHWAGRDVRVRFEMQRVRTGVLSREAVNEGRRSRT